MKKAIYYVLGFTFAVSVFVISTINNELHPNKE